MKLIKTLKDKGYEVSVTTVTKNGKDVPCFIVKKSRATTGVILYEDREVTEEELDVIETMIVKESSSKGSLLYSFLNDKEMLLQNVIVAVRPTTTEEVVKRQVSEDVETYVRLILDKNPEKDMASMLVTQQFLKSSGVTEDELWEAAEKNTRAAITVQSLAPLVNSLVPETVTEDDLVPMFVITNSSMLFGAGPLGCSWFAEELKECFGNADLAVLPSSIHELIIVPLDGSEGQKESLTQMVQDVNEAHLAEDEILANRAFFFENETLQIAG